MSRHPFPGPSRKDKHSPSQPHTHYPPNRAPFQSRRFARLESFCTLPRSSSLSLSLLHPSPRDPLVVHHCVGQRLLTSRLLVVRRCPQRRRRRRGEGLLCHEEPCMLRRRCRGYHVERDRGEARSDGSESGWRMVGNGCVRGEGLMRGMRGRRRIQEVVGRR